MPVGVGLAAGGFRLLAVGAGHAPDTWSFIIDRAGIRIRGDVVITHYLLMDYSKQSIHDSGRTIPDLIQEEDPTPGSFCEDR